MGGLTNPGRLSVAECHRAEGPKQVDGEGREPSPVGAARLVMGGARAAYGTVMVVPSPVAVTEKVPEVLDAYP